MSPGSPQPLFTVVNLGWFGLNTEIAASILAAITHSSTDLWDVVVGGFESSSSSTA